MLEISGLCAGYDVGEVLHDISLEVGTGEAVAVIGSNGAGKTTLLRTICRLLPGSRGTIVLDDEEIGSEPAHALARRGVSFVPAERHLFPHMSVSENLTLGAYPDRPDERQRERVFELFPRLRDRRGQPAGTMSGGEQQMLAVGRALMSTPRLLLLDEPTTGLAPSLAADAYDVLDRLRSEGITILVAEQQVPLALDLADRAYVLEDGRIQMEGTAAELEDNPDVQRAYLGIA